MHPVFIYSSGYYEIVTLKFLIFLFFYQPEHIYKTILPLMSIWLSTQFMEQRHGKYFIFLSFQDNELVGFLSQMWLIIFTITFQITSRINKFKYIWLIFLSNFQTAYFDHQGRALTTLNPAV